MREKLWLGVAAALLLVVWPVFAGAAEVTVVDSSARPLADAVVELSGPAPSSAAQARQPPAEAIVDQRRETFLPLVTVVRTGGHVIFTNSDTTMHQVYSFSPVKQFAFEIDEGRRSAPVLFDKPGIAAIGCNIHDRMITYVYVADSPLAAKTDHAGLAAFGDLVPGNYRGMVWHPQLAPGAALHAFAFAVANGNAQTTVMLPVSAAVASTKKSTHMQMY
jgi:plastocyanin